MSSWIPYHDGITVGTKGPQGDVILLDEVHPDGARMTIKRGTKYISVSCNINNWINHTRFFDKVRDAKREFTVMKISILEVTELLKTPDVNQIKIWEAISNFVRRFP